MLMMNQLVKSHDLDQKKMNFYYYLLMLMLMLLKLMLKKKGDWIIRMPIDNKDKRRAYNYSPARALRGGPA